MKSNIYIRLMLLLLSLVTVFHLCIVVKLVPYKIAWGGRLKNDFEMYVFEAISIIINLFLISVLLIKGSYLKVQMNGKVINTVLWVFFFIFTLNTIGNIIAKTTFEKLFSVLTFLSVVFIWKILMKKEQHSADK